jgi:mycothiol synthase
MFASLPEGYTLRPVKMNDVDSVVAMLNAEAKQTLGVEKFTLDMFLPEWTTPHFDLERDTRLVLAPDGCVAGYYEVWDLDDPHVQIYCWGGVHPVHTGKGIGTFLLKWAELRARQAIPLAPAEARVKLLVDALDIKPQAHELYRSCGFQLVRHSWRMVTDLNGPIPQPQWPAEITLRTMQVGQDERAVFAASREAFQDHWGHVERPFEEEYARWLHHNKSRQDFDPTLWFLAMDGEQIAGICLCRMTTHDDPQMGWVSVLAVRKPWRQRGLGLALLYNAFAEFKRRGKSKAGLGVDAENLTGATRLYQRAGMRSDPNRQFSLYEKELRPGIELATQAL